VKQQRQDSGFVKGGESPVTDQDNCYCATLADLAVVPMGGDGLDERVFASLEKLCDHGGGQWWLYLSECSVCSQHWMVAQDERIYDNFYLKRLKGPEAEDIRQRRTWPTEFATYEKVLRLGRTLNSPCIFLDPLDSALVWTKDDLRRERPDISIKEIAYLLGIPVATAAKL